jgi:hypothetical protein
MGPADSIVFTAGAKGGDMQATTAIDGDGVVKAIEAAGLAKVSHTTTLLELMWPRRSSRSCTTNASPNRSSNSTPGTYRFAKRSSATYVSAEGWMRYTPPRRSILPCAVWKSIFLPRNQVLVTTPARARPS